MKEKKFTTSKLILWIVTGALLCISAFACVVMWRQNDLTALPFLLAAWGVDGGATFWSYFDKAKAENEIKLNQGGQLAELQETVAALQAELANLRTENTSLKRKQTALEKKLNSQ